MSITDAVSFSTTWAEQTRGYFHAGTLSNIDDCVTEVQDKLKRGTLSASTTPTTTQVQRWLIRAKQELMELRQYSWTRRYAYATLTADTYRYALPPDYNGGYLTVRDTTNDRLVQAMSAAHFDLKYPDPSEEASDEVLAYTVKGMELWLIPPPGGTDRIEIEYDRSGADSTTTDFDYLPEIERFRCCDFALYQSYLALHQWAEAGLYKQEWLYNMEKAKKSDAKKTWQRTGFQAISTFQEWYAAGRGRRLRKY